MFERKCNTVMVELLPLLFDEDIQLVYRLLIEFYEKTDSQVAKRILDQWPHPTKKFVKVRDYITLNLCVCHGNFKKI